MLSEKERARFSVSNSPMQAMIILTPLLLSLVKHIFFVYAVATALVQYTLVLITQWKDLRRNDVDHAMSFVLADILCVLSIISYFKPPSITKAIIVGMVSFLLVLWSVMLIINTIKYLHETAKP